MGIAKDDKEWDKLCKIACDKKGFIYKYFKRENGIIWVYFICKEHEYKGIQKINYSNITKNTTKGCGCILRRYTHDDFIRDKNIKPSIEILSQYQKNSIKIKCRCKICGNIWWATPNKLKSGRGCPACKVKNVGLANRMSHEEFVNRVKQVSPNLVVQSIYDGWDSKISVLCLECGTTSVHRAGMLARGDAGCSRCRASLGEMKISDWLKNHNIEFERQKKFDDCVVKDMLRFDFYLPYYNILIEYQGEQHYKPVNFKGKGHEKESIESFEYLKIRDATKRDYCKLKNIKLIEIPYWEKENIEIILDKIIYSKNP